MDLNLVLGYWGGEGKRAYHHTAPVNTLYALHEALVILQEEGLENAWARHELNHQALRAGLEAGLARLDLVTREEFDVQTAVLARTREKLARLEAQVCELEQKIL